MSGGRRAPHPWSWGPLSCRPFPLSPVIAGCRSVGTRWGQAGAVPSGRPLSALMSLAPLMSPQALPLPWALCCLSRDSVSTHGGAGLAGGGLGRDSRALCIVRPGVRDGSNKSGAGAGWGARTKDPDLERIRYRPVLQGKEVSEAGAERVGSGCGW